jgi:hypothetical protein
MEFRYSYRRAQQTRSLSSIESEMLLLPARLIEIQEKMCKKVSFFEMACLYSSNSTVFTFEDGELRAFIVTERSGMEQLSPSTWAPLRIRTRYICHNGNAFVWRGHDFLISQFGGQRLVGELKYIPGGFLPKEAEHRVALIARGRKYWTLAQGVHYKQANLKGVWRSIYPSGATFKH